MIGWYGKVARDERPVLNDIEAIVSGTRSTVQPGINASRSAATPSEEAVDNSGCLQEFALGWFKARHGLGTFFSRFETGRGCEVRCEHRQGLEEQAHPVVSGEAFERGANVFGLL